MGGARPEWVDDAALLPLAFAQVREDPLIDRAVLRRIGPGARMLMIASGGCTAALLAAEPHLAELHLVDANPAQLALTRLKLALLSRPPAERKALLGHTPLSAQARGAAISAILADLGLGLDMLGPSGLVAALGPDHLGRYEACCHALSHRLAGPDLARLLTCADPRQQTALIAPDTACGQALDHALMAIFAPPILVELFGSDATRDPARPFHAHFHAQLQTALGRWRARDNPWLWAMLAGPAHLGPLPPWLDLPVQPHLPTIATFSGPMLTALRRAPGSWDVVHLSNIVDWLDGDAAKILLAAAAEALRPGGWLVVRQLNSTIAVRDLAPSMAWDDDGSRNLHAADRSFFYRELHLGQRRDP